MSVAPSTVSLRPVNAVAAGVATAGLAAVTVALAAVNPSQHALGPPCAFHRLTGGWCPGCGATRATHQLLTGHLATALHDNLLWVLAIPVVAYVFASWALASVGVPVLPPLRLSRRQGLLVVGAVLAFFVLRNLPMAPFTALAPVSPLP